MTYRHCIRLYTCAIVQRRSGALLSGPFVAALSFLSDVSLPRYSRNFLSLRSHHNLKIICRFVTILLIFFSALSLPHYYISSALVLTPNKPTFLHRAAVTLTSDVISVSPRKISSPGALLQSHYTSTRTAMLLQYVARIYCQTSRHYLHISCIASQFSSHIGGAVYHPY